MPSSSHSELVRQRVNPAAVLLPNELEPAVVGRSQAELEIRVGGNGLVHIDDEHVDAVVAADELVDDQTRDDVAFVVFAQAGFHLMADDSFDLKDFTLRRGARHLYAWHRGDHFLPHSNNYQAQPLVATSTQV